MEFDFEKNLKEIFNYSNFKNIKIYSNPNEGKETILKTQLDILNIISKEINKSLNGECYKDIFFTSSTGSGKSLLFQLPSIDLHKNGLITIVITPLKALMKDQVGFLKNKKIDFATYINSDDTYLEREEKLQGIKKGKYSLIYLSPEFLVKYHDLNLLFNFKDSQKIGFYVIDEAHCVSTWGKNFRPDYWYISKRFNKWRKQSVCNAPILALTATAVYNGDYDSVFDIIELLDLRDPHIFLSYTKRENIEIKIEKYNPEGKYSNNKKDEFVAEKIKELINNYKKIIVYLPFRSSAKKFKNILENKNIKTELFVGDMLKDDRNKVYDLLKNGLINCVIATKAFGMGINIDDIDCVYHYAINKSLTDYVQEIGRGGREEKINTLALTHYNSKDLNFTRILNITSGLTQWQIKKIIEKILYIYQIEHKSVEGKWIILYPETFINIFKQNDDIEKKMKIALLLIEKDFVEEYGLPYITFSIPSGTEVYCSIDNENVEKLKKTPYFKCFSLERTIKDNMRYEESTNNTIVYDKGDIWRFDLEKLWSNFYKNENLGSLKFKFFSEKPLIEDIKIYPRLRLISNLHDNYKVTKDELILIIDKLKDIFNSFSNKYFLKEDLDKKLKENDIKIENLSDIIINFFKISQNENDFTNQKSYQFIYERIFSNNQKEYRVIKNNIYRFNSFLLKSLNKMFINNEEFDYFIPTDDKDKLIFVGFLELLDLASFQILGSKKIAFNVYVSDPVKLKNLLQTGYKNKLLSKIKLREENEIKLINKFANEYINSDKAWDFIENYFLGNFNYEINKEIKEDLNLDEENNPEEI